MSSIKLNESVGQNITKRRHEEVDHIPKRHSIKQVSKPKTRRSTGRDLPLLNLITLIPTTQQVHTARQEARFKDADEHPAHHNDTPVPRKAHAQHDCAPAEHQPVEEPLGSDPAQGQGRGQLEEEVRDEEDEEGEGITVADVEVQVLVHAGYARVGEVHAVEAGDGVEDSEDGNQTVVNLAPSSVS